MPFTAGTNDARNYIPIFKMGGTLPGASTNWGSQTIVLSVHSTSTTSAGATTPINIGGTAPVAATVKYVQIIPTNNTNAVWEIASTTNTKAIVIFGQPSASFGAGSSVLVTAATSILNVAVASGEQLTLSSTTVGGSAIVVVGLETAN